MIHFKKSTIYFLVFSILLGVVSSGCRLKEEVEQVQNYNGIELTYYKFFDDSDVIEPLISQFEIDHPGLKINYKKFSDFEEYQKTILDEMAEGEGPDIFSMQNTWFVSNYKKLSPMPETLGTPSDFELTFVDVAYKDLVRTDENGYEKIYGLPMTVDTLALYYNKDHFEDNLPSKGRPSSTWEGIKDDVSLLNKEDNSFDRFDVSGIAIGRADNISRAVDILYLLFLQHGVDFYNENISKATFANKHVGAFDYPAMSALELYTSFSDDKSKNYSWNEFVTSEDTEGSEIESFAKGNVSMIVGYAYTYNLIINYIKLLNSAGENAIDKDSIRVAAIPQLYDPEVSSEKRVTYANYFAETVSRNSQYPEIAWEFLVFLTKKDNLDYYFDKTHKPTSRRDMIDGQKVDPVYGVFASQVGYAESFPILDYFIYNDIFKNVISKTNLSGVSGSDLTDAQKTINAMLPLEGLLVPKVNEE